MKYFLWFVAVFTTAFMVSFILFNGTFTEPTEMAILPNLDLLVALRREELMQYYAGYRQIFI